MEGKYAPTHSEEKIIRLNGNIKGLVIWNQLWVNWVVIQNHSFWEVGNGDKALFLEYAWQQMLELDKDQYQ